MKNEARAVANVNSIGVWEARAVLVIVNAVTSEIGQGYGGPCGPEGVILATLCKDLEARGRRRGGRRCRRNQPRQEIDSPNCIALSRRVDISIPGTAGVPRPVALCWSGGIKCHPIPTEVAIQGGSVTSVGPNSSEVVESSVVRYRAVRETRGATVPSNDRASASEPLRHRHPELESPSMVRSTTSASNVTACVTAATFVPIS